MNAFGLFNALSVLVRPDLTPVPAVPVLEDAAVCATAAEQDPMPALHSGDGRGSTSEPDWLRVLRQRVERAEVERDLALADYQLGQARFASQQPVWSTE